MVGRVTNWPRNETDFKITRSEEIPFEETPYVLLKLEEMTWLSYHFYNFRQAERKLVFYEGRGDHLDGSARQKAHSLTFSQEGGAEALQHLTQAPPSFSVQQKFDWR